MLEATEALLGDGLSYPELGIERIATRAGISRTAFYFYFHDKREVLLRLADDVADRLYGEADIWFSGQGDAEDELRQAIGNVARLYREHGAVLRAIVEGATFDEEIARFWHTILARFVDATRQRIEAEQRAGRAAATQGAATAFALCWMTERVFHQQIVQDEPLATGELVDALAGVWVRGVYGT
ncbi:MAG: TetR/AcrR family transcriptional regulator, ethionamide resistance regulator [Solirubrobacteraceae bacterium]|nr:TetR/AcrR family transcriptional regulator, ethionamide resistance regulator [Solirubrobacteraceae bacterium]